MPFVKPNAPATFCTLMNKVFRPFLDKCVIVYLDDIVVYSATLEDHVKYIRQVFQALREKEFYVPLEVLLHKKRLLSPPYMSWEDYDG